MSSIFQQDLATESVITTHLTETFFPDFFDSFEVVSNTDQQLKGIDIIGEKNGTSVKIDIKSQSDYLNDPRDTFILEILAQTQGEIQKGWYTKEDIETDYYLFTWLPKVDQFKFNSKTEEIHYYPAETLSDPPEFLTKTGDHYTFNSTETPQFSNQLYELNVNLLKQSEDTKVFTPQSIREHHVLLVDKQNVESHMDENGLSKDRLVGDAINVAQTQENQRYPVTDVYSLFYTSRYHQNPVNLVVSYDLYKELSDLTCTIHGDSLSYMTTL